MSRNKAVWIVDYDYCSDKCYQRPGCPKCETPIGKGEDGKYHCFSCGEEVAVDDPEMQKWLADREETKVEIHDCVKLTYKKGMIERRHGCGGKSCMVIHYIRDPITLKWQTAYGKCKKCGQTFFV